MGVGAAGESLEQERARRNCIRLPSLARSINVVFSLVVDHSNQGAQQPFQSGPPTSLFWGRSHRLAALRGNGKRPREHARVPVV